MKKSKTKAKHTENPEKKPSNGIIPIDGKMPAEETNDKSKRNNEKSNNRSAFGKYIQLSLAIFTLGTLIVVSLQLVTFQKQTKIFQSQLINQTRAWITVKDASYQELREGQKIISTVKFINSGNSPALNLTIHNNVAIRNTPIEAPMKFIPINNPAPSVAVIGPQVLHKSIIVANVIANKALIEKINTGDLLIYVWGVVKYDDIFNGKHETGYCLKSRVGTTIFDVCENNNYAN